MGAWAMIKSILKDEDFREDMHYADREFKSPEEEAYACGYTEGYADAMRKAKEIYGERGGGAMGGERSYGASRGMDGMQSSMAGERSGFADMRSRMRAMMGEHMDERRSRDSMGRFK